MWILLVGAAIVLFIYKVRKAQSYWQRKGIKCIPPKFFFGSFTLSKSFSEKLVDDYNYFPTTRYHGFYQFLKPILLIKDPELIKQIGIKQFEHFVDHLQFVDKNVDPIWNSNLFAMTGEKWKDMRSTLSPSFTSSKMKIMFQLIDDSAQKFVKYFQETQKSTIGEYEIKDIVSRFANDVIASTAFGINCDSLLHRDNEFFLTGKDLSDFSGLKTLKFFVAGISPFLSRVLNIKVVSSKNANFLTNIIKDTVHKREKHNIVRPDMIHLLLEAKKGRYIQDEELKVNVNEVNEGFSSVEESKISRNSKKRPINMKDIISQALIFLLGGFDSISTTMTFLLYEITANPDVQKQLREELLTVEGEITYEKLLGMKYLDMVISETLRKWPPVISTDRVVTKPVTIEPKNNDEAPLHLEKNAAIWIPIYAIHRNPEFYPEPEKFIPERFSDENKHNIKPSTYIPFGIGPRNCIASRFSLLETKLLVYHILKNFEVVPVERTQIPLILAPDVFNIAAKDGVWLGLKKIVQ